MNRFTKASQGWTPLLFMAANFSDVGTTAINGWENELNPFSLALGWGWWLGIKLIIPTLAALFLWWWASEHEEATWVRYLFLGGSLALLAVAASNVAIFYGND